MEWGCSRGDGVMWQGAEWYSFSTIFVENDPRDPHFSASGFSDWADQHVQAAPAVPSRNAPPQNGFIPRPAGLPSLADTNMEDTALAPAGPEANVTWTNAPPS